MPARDRNELNEQLSAYLDGELGEADAAEIQRRLAEDPEARKTLDALRETSEAVRALPRQNAPAGLAGGVLAQIERDQLLSGRPKPPRALRRRGLYSRLLASAAVLVFAVGGGFWAFRQITDAMTRPERQLAAGKPATDELSRTATRGETPLKSDVSDPGATKDPPDVEHDVRNRTRAIEESIAAGWDADTTERPPAPPVVAEGAVGPAVADTGEEPIGAPLEVRLNLGVTQREVLRSPFANEAVVLDVACPSPEERDRTLDRLNAFLAANRIRALETVVGDTEPVSPALAFYVDGQAPENYIARRDTHQLLVRAAPTQLDALVQNVGGPSGQQLALAIGPDVVARDLAGARRALGVAGTSGERRLGAPAKGGRGKKSEQHPAFGRAAQRSVIREAAEAAPSVPEQEAKDADRAAGTGRRGRGEPSQPAAPGPGMREANDQKTAAGAAEDLITVVIQLRTGPLLDRMIEMGPPAPPETPAGAGPSATTRPAAASRPAKDP